jgi:pimeloyl-ACP methyl ester carboxylesterase
MKTASTINNRTNVRDKAPAALRGCFQLGSRLTPGLTSRVAARLFTLPHRSRKSRPREEQTLRDAVTLPLEIEGRRLAAWSWGEGPTVLLHHGWNGRGAQLGAFVKPLVAAGYRVVTYDAPAHGSSPGRFTNGVELARTISAVSRHLGGLHAIVAHSLGCLATSYALRQRLAVERIVFVSPPADMVTFTREFAEMVDLGERAHDMMLTHFERTLAMNWEDFSTEKLAEYDRLARGDQTPLLVVHDTEDLRVPVQHAQRIHRAWEGSRLIETSRLGHQRILRDEGVIGHVVEFLAGD